MKNKFKTVLAGPEAEKFFAEQNRRRERRQAFWRGIAKWCDKAGTWTCDTMMPFFFVLFAVIVLAGGVFGGWDHWVKQKQLAEQRKLIAQLDERISGVQSLAEYHASFQEKQIDSLRADLDKTLDAQIVVAKGIEGVLQNHKETFNILRERIDRLDDQVNPSRTNEGIMLWASTHLFSFTNITITNVPVTNGTSRTNLWWPRPGH